MQKIMALMLAVVMLVPSAAAFPSHDLTVSVSPEEKHLNQGDSKAVLADANPNGIYDVFVSPFFCEDENNNYRCDFGEFRTSVNLEDIGLQGMTPGEIIAISGMNPLAIFAPSSSEFSAVVEETGTFFGESDTQGKANIRLTVPDDAVSGTRYIYFVIYVSEDRSEIDTAKAYAYVNPTSIPEFPSFLLPVGLSFIGAAFAMSQKPL